MSPPGLPNASSERASPSDTAAPDTKLFLTFPPTMFPWLVYDLPTLYVISLKYKHSIGYSDKGYLYQLMQFYAHEPKIGCSNVFGGPAWRSFAILVFLVFILPSRPILVLC